MEQNTGLTDVESIVADVTNQSTDRLSVWAAIIMSLAVVTVTRALTVSNAYSTIHMGGLQLFLMLEAVTVSFSLGVLIVKYMLDRKNHSRIRAEGAIWKFVLFSLACFLTGLLHLGFPLVKKREQFGFTIADVQFVDK